jgi:hypothetical protein
MNERRPNESDIVLLCKLIALSKLNTNNLTDVNYIILYRKDQWTMSKKLSSAQMRAARALLRWSAIDLATHSKVGVATIRRVEVVEGEIPVTPANEAALRKALEAAGVEFIDENGGGPGVRLRKPVRGKSAK